MTEHKNIQTMTGDLFATATSSEAARLVKELEQVETLIPRVLQLKAKHRATLPEDVQELSRMLTSERAELTRSYLQTPANLSAYVSYFLPWNLHRLTCLLSGLELVIPKQARILDLGSGPLTLPLALWLSRPDLRGERLTIICSDRSKKIMSLGAELLRGLMRTAGTGENWRIELLHMPLEKALEQQRGKVDLLTLCNVLNETGGRRGREGAQQLHTLVRQAANKVSAEGRIVAVEPGTRAGGGLISTLREEALHAGFAALAPCTHQLTCPMQDRRRGMWCHFTFKTRQVSAGLQRLSKQAGLEKEGLSLSFALLGRQTAETGGMARIVSQPFIRPGKSPAAYGCGPDGLLLVEAAAPEQLWPGRVLAYEVGKERDAKSGALLAREKR